MVTPMGLFFYTWGEVLARDAPLLLVVNVGCFACAIVSLLAVSFTDPGILPRNPDPSARKQQQPPLYRNRTDEDGNVFTDTWCMTCHIYRPPRASHCPDCDNCVRDFDHHCPFTRNCIGGRNYAFFILFLVSISLSLGALLFSCLVLGSEPAYLRGTASQDELANLFNFILSVFSMVLGLLLWGFTAYHLSLVISGLTTKEYLKGRKNGAKRMSVSQRLECCHLAQSEIDPRRLVPVVQSGHRPNSKGVPTISHTQL